MRYYMYGPAPFSLHKLTLARPAHRSAKTSIQTGFRHHVPQAVSKTTDRFVSRCVRAARKFSYFVREVADFKRHAARAAIFLLKKK
jgi:hypothetical protein